MMSMNTINSKLWSSRNRRVLGQIRGENSGNQNRVKIKHHGTLILLYKTVFSNYADHIRRTCLFADSSDTLKRNEIFRGFVIF